MTSDDKLTVENLLEDPWLIVEHPIPQDADEKLLKAARDAAVLCELETQLERPESPDPKKIDAILTDIRHRLGESEPEPKPLEPGMKNTLDELEKTWPAQAQKTAAQPQDPLDRLIEEQDKIARAKQGPTRAQPPKDRDRER